SWDSRIDRPVYTCGPPLAQPTISVTRYLNPGGGTLWWASFTAGLALSRASVMTRSIRSSTTQEMLYIPPSRSYRLGFCGSAGIVRMAKSEANTFPCRAERSHRFRVAPTCLPCRSLTKAGHVVAFLTRRSFGEGRSTFQFSAFQPGAVSHLLAPSFQVVVRTRVALV